MQLHSLNKELKAPQRVGRGGKRGTTSGRGTKGQKSRSGRKLRPAERDLIIRIPKKRGFRNKPKSEPALVIPLSKIAKMTGVIDRASLKKAGLVPARHLTLIKILSQGDAPSGVTIKGLAVSREAKKKIEDAKGTVE
jgi:large subunit ribosomal protein L15